MFDPISLTVDVPGEVESGLWPVTVGVPFADDISAGLEVETDARVEYLGTPIPTQTRVQAVWPSGLVRWLLVDFQVDADEYHNCPNDVEACYKLVQGQGTEHTYPLRLTTPSPGSGEPFGVEIQETSLVAQVASTGLLELSLEASFPQIWSPAVEGPIQFVLKHGEEEFLAHVDSDPGIAVTVEEQGELRTTLRARGWFETGGPPEPDGSEVFCRFDIRFEFFAGSSLVRILHTLIYTDKAAGREIALLAVKVPLVSGFDHAFGKNSEQPDEATTKSTGDGRVTQILDSSRCPQVLFDAGSASSGRTSGWCSLTRAADDGGLAVALRDAWQNAPNGYRLDDDTLYIELWPAPHDPAPPEPEPMPPLDLRAEAILHRWYGGDEAYGDLEAWYCELKKKRSQTPADPYGLAKTHEVWLEAWSGPEEVARGPRLSVQAHHPVFAVAPEQNCKSGALGPVHQHDSVAFPDAEAVVEAYFDQLLRWQQQLHAYGWLIYGDVPTQPRTKLWGPIAANLNELNRAWVASHYGFPRVPWLLFYRSGLRKYLELAEANSRHVMDIDRCHHGELPQLESVDCELQLEAWELGEGGEEKYGPTECDYDFSQLRRFRGHHFWDEAALIPGDGIPILTNYEVLDFLAYSGYLRGDLRGLHVLEDWYAAVLHFHPMDDSGDPSSWVSKDRFLRLYHREDEVRAEYAPAWTSLEPWDRHLPSKTDTEGLPLRALRHIAPPLGTLVERGRAAGFPITSKTRWPCVVKDYVRSVLAMYAPAPPGDSDGPTSPLAWKQVRDWELYDTGQRMRHAWSSLFNVVRLFEDMPEQDTTFAGDLASELRAAVVDWAYRSSLVSFDGVEAVEGVAQAYLLGPIETADTDDLDGEQRQEDLLDLGKATLDLMISRTNTEEKGSWTVDEPIDDICEPLSSWRYEWGPRGSSGKVLFDQTYALQGVPVLLHALAVSGTQQERAWFRLVGPRMPRLRVRLDPQDARPFRMKIRLSENQGLRMSVGTQVVSVSQQVQPDVYTGDPIYIVRVEDYFELIEEDVLIDFDRASVLNPSETVAIQRAIVDVLRVEGASVEVESHEESFADWKRGVHAMLENEKPEPATIADSTPVFRVFGRRFWFDVPDEVTSLTVTVYVGYQGSLSFDPVLRVYPPGAEETSHVATRPLDYFSNESAFKDANGQISALEPLTVTVFPEANKDTLELGVWSFGPVAHMIDPYRDGDLDRQRIPEAKGDLGYRTWTTIEFEGSDKAHPTVLYTARPTSE